MGTDRFMDMILVAAGFAALLVGGDLLVRGSVAIARKAGVSPLLIGLTLVGFGTSMPELLTSLLAAWAGAPGISIGNVVGSNTCNILLILGLGALMRPILIDKAAFRRDGLTVALAALAGLGLVLSGELTRPAGFVFVAFLLAYVGYTYVQERRTHDASAILHEAEAASVPTLARNGGLAALVTAAGLALTLAGAWMLVKGAVALAENFGVSDAIIGVTVVAVGTSLPELVTTVIAAIKRHGDVALGNIIGSNIFNIFGILGVTAIVKPIPVPREIAVVDIWVMCAATLLLLVFAITGWRICRKEGAAFLVAYGAYVGYLISVA